MLQIGFDVFKIFSRLSPFFFARSFIKSIFHDVLFIFFIFDIILLIPYNLFTVNWKILNYLYYKDNFFNLGIINLNIFILNSISNYFILILWFFLSIFRIYNINLKFCKSVSQFNQFIQMSNDMQILIHHKMKFIKYKY